MIDQLVAQIDDLNKYDGGGTTSKCYCIGNYALLYGSIRHESIAQRKAALEKYLSAGIQLAPILEYQFDPNAEVREYGEETSYQDGWILQKRALGTEIYKSWHKGSDICSLEEIDSQITSYFNELDKYITLIQKFANMPQEQLNKFIKGYFMLNQSELLVDPSKPTNFFYDEEYGFTFIDLQIKETNMNNEYNQPKWSAKYVTMLLMPFLPTIKLYQEGYNRSGATEYIDGMFSIKEHQAITEAQQQLINKLKIGFTNNGLDRSIIEEIIAERKEKFEVLNQAPYNDEQEISAIIKSKLSFIIANNIDNNVVSDAELSKSYTSPFDGMTI